MPDVLTHLLIGISIALLVRRDGPRSEQMLIVLGAVLIDIERPIAWMLANTALDWIGLSSAFHSVVGAIVLSCSAASCFGLEGTVFKARVGLVFIGCISHLILDMVMYPWTELGIPLLYPLQLPFSFHLVWPDFWFYPLFGCALLLIVLCIRYFSSFHARYGESSQKREVHVGKELKSGASVYGDGYTSRLEGI